MKGKSKKPHNEKPITLAPLDEKDALKALLETPPMPKRKRGKKKRRSPRRK